MNEVEHEEKISFEERRPLAASVPKGNDEKAYYAAVGQKYIDKMNAVLEKYKHLGNVDEFKKSLDLYKGYIYLSDSEANLEKDLKKYIFEPFSKMANNICDILSTDSVILKNRVTGDYKEYRRLLNNISSVFDDKEIKGAIYNALIENGVDSLEDLKINTIRNAIVGTEKTSKNETRFRNYKLLTNIAQKPEKFDYDLLFQKMAQNKEFCELMIEDAYNQLEEYKNADKLIDYSNAKNAEYVMQGFANTIAVGERLLYEMSIDNSNYIQNPDARAVSSGKKIDFNISKSANQPEPVKKAVSESAAKDSKKSSLKNNLDNENEIKFKEMASAVSEVVKFNLPENGKSDTERVATMASQILADLGKKNLHPGEGKRSELYDEICSVDDVDKANKLRTEREAKKEKERTEAESKKNNPTAKASQIIDDLSKENLHPGEGEKSELYDDSTIDTEKANKLKVEKEAKEEKERAEAENKKELAEDNNNQPLAENVKPEVIDADYSIDAERYSFNTSSVGKSKKQQESDHILRSILAPKPYSRNIVANTELLEQCTYEVPDGMTEEQAMMVVIGAMLDERNFDIAHSDSSSASNIARINFIQQFLFRDYIRDDEVRGHMFGEAMLKSRQEAKAALKAYSNGDHSGVNDMLSRAGSFIHKYYLSSPISNDAQWHAINALNYLMEDSAGNAEFDRAIGPRSESEKAKDVFVAEMQLGEQISESMLIEKNQDKRSQLMLEAMVHITLAYDHKLTARKPEEAALSIVFEETNDFAENNFKLPNKEKPEDDWPVDDDYQKFPLYKNVLAKYENLYRETHPSALIEKMNTEKGRKEVYDKYAETIKESREYQRALKEGNIDFYFGNLDKRVKIDDYLKPEERQKLNDKWDSIAEAGKKEIISELAKYKTVGKDTEESLQKVYIKHNIKNPVILCRTYIKDAYKNVGRMMTNQEEIYVMSDNYDKIYRIYSPDLKEFKVTEVKELPNVEARSVELNNEFAEINAVLPLLRQSLEIDKALKFLHKNEKNNSIVEQYHYAVTAMRRCIADYKIVPAEFTRCAENLSNLANSASKHTDDAYEKGVLTQLEKFGKDIISAQKAAEEKLSEEKENLQKSNAKAQEIPKDVKERNIALMLPILEMQEKKVKIERKMVKGAGDRGTRAYNGLKLYIDEIKNDLEKHPENKEKYNALLTSLNALDLTTRGFYERDRQGKYPAFTKENQSELLELYNDAIKNVTEIENGYRKTDFEGISVLIDGVHSLLERDVNKLTSFIASGELSLADEIGNGVLRVNVAENKPFYFEKIEALDGISKASMERNAAKADEYAASMTQSQKEIWGHGSPEFRKMQDAMLSYSAAMKAIGDNANSRGYLYLQAKIENLQNCANAYIAIKEDKELNENGQKRFKLAKEIKKFSDDRLVEFKNALHKKDEIETEELNAKVKAGIIIEDAYNQKLKNFSKSIPNDNSKLSRFGIYSVNLSIQALVSFTKFEKFNNAAKEQITRSMADLVAYDVMITERASLINQKKSDDIPGPIEQLFNKRDGYEVFQPHIIQNKDFQKAIDEMTPDKIKYYIANGVHGLTVTVEKAAKAYKEPNPEEKAVIKENPQIIPNKN